MQGRELTYVLPVQYCAFCRWCRPMPPTSATPATPASTASKGWRSAPACSRLSRITLVALGGLMTILALIGIARRTQRARAGRTADRRPALLRLAARELSAAQRESASGWTGLADPVRSRAAHLGGRRARPARQPAAVDPTAEQGQGRFLIRRLGRDKRRRCPAR